MPTELFSLLDRPVRARPLRSTAALNTINKPDRKIITVEDPVEYELPGINQVMVKTDIGMTFAAALRAMMRQAPNVIMLGEIRDEETAGIAIQAALTGTWYFPLCTPMMHLGLWPACRYWHQAISHCLCGESHSCPTSSA